MFECRGRQGGVESEVHSKGCEGNNLNSPVLLRFTNRLRSAATLLPSAINIFPSVSSFPIPHTDLIYSPRGALSQLFLKIRESILMTSILLTRSFIMHDVPAFLEIDPSSLRGIPSSRSSINRNRRSGRSRSTTYTASRPARPFLPVFLYPRLPVHPVHTRLAIPVARNDGIGHRPTRLRGNIGRGIIWKHKNAPDL